MDTMAIKSGEINNMQHAIETYTVAVEDCIKSLKKYKIDNSTGFYGKSQADTVNTYIDNTCIEINKIVRHFDEFKEKLDQVAEAYKAQDAAISTGEVAAAKANEGDLVTVNRMS
ncbi:MAG: hypothetical protein ACI33S_03200 [Bacilli bacterium]